jgi:hypothetical protein
MESQMKGLAGLGRFEDDTLAHVATGEMIVPPQSITPQTRSMIESDMMNMGMNPNQYVVGGENSINPNTGMPEFFLKKLVKKLGKAVKKIAPIAVNFIPGVGPIAKAALTAAAGKASGMSTKEALLSGALSFGGSKLGSAVKGGKFPRLKNFFTPGENVTGRFGGKFGPNIRRGIGQFFGKAFTPQDQLPQVEVQGGGGFSSPTYTINGEPVTAAELQKMGFSFDDAGNPIAPTQGSVSDYDPVTGKGQSRIGQVEDFLKGFGGGQKGQSGIGQIEDMLRGRQSDDVRSGGGLNLGNLGIAGLAGLVGKLAYEEAKRNKGIPLTPLTTMDQLGRYNIAAEIARQKGEEMPSRVEFGLNPEGLPVLQGGGVGITPRNVATGGMIYGQADGDHNGIMQFAEGGVVQMQEGGDVPTDPSDFPPMDGDINGPGTETSDDIPAMLSDGEFVMTAKAVRGAGGFDMAKGNNGIVTLTPNGNPGRESGNRIMYKLMEHFGSMA